jgi:F-type H+-transporting ATPase subunit delta
MSQDSPARNAPTGAGADAEQVALLWAEALLTDSLLAEFDSLVADVLDPNPDLEEILASPQISHEEKVGILRRTLGSQASKPLLDFLQIVSRQGQFGRLRAIHRQTHELYRQVRGAVRVRVTTAVPLSAELARRVADQIRGLVGGEPIVEQEVDPGLIGGIVVRVGDTVYDGSLAAQLEGTRQRMIKRTADEVQARRDRFRYTPRD